MAREAERLMAGSGWLPELLRTPGLSVEATSPAETAESAEPAAEEDAALPAFLHGDPDTGYAVAAE